MISLTYLIKYKMATKQVKPGISKSGMDDTTRGDKVRMAASKNKTASLLKQSTIKKSPKKLTPAIKNKVRNDVSKLFGK